MVKITSIPRPAQAARPAGNRMIHLLGLTALLVTGIALSGCNTVAGAGQDVSATGTAVTRGASDVKRGL